MCGFNMNMFYLGRVNTEYERSHHHQYEQIPLPIYMRKLHFQSFFQHSLQHDTHASVCDLYHRLRNKPKAET